MYSVHCTVHTQSRAVEQLHLPHVVQQVYGQLTAPFGDALLRTRDTIIGHEICEELWNPDRWEPDYNDHSGASYLIRLPASFIIVYFHYTP